MARLDQEVFQAGANVATDWAQAGGHAQADFAAGAQFKRGINLDLSIQALAQVDASVARFLSAELSGQASASASVKAQIQAPMNLFGEIGIAVRLQAVAELAAAVQVGIGLKVGDFLELAGSDPRMQGLPTSLLRVFLSEIKVGGGVYAKAALTAQAYAQLAIVGTAIDQPQRNLRAGFNIIAGMGAGLKAGAGFRAFAALEFDNFSRFVARATDLIVNEAVEMIIAGIPPENILERNILRAARPGLKIPFRLAYELGEHLALNRPGANTTGVESVALRCTQVFLEEAQRFLLDSMVEAAQAAFADALRGWAGSLAKSAWDASLTRRRALADHLAQAPQEPFLTDAATLAWWRDAAMKMADVVSALDSRISMPGGMTSAAAFWAASELALVAATRAARADASVSLLGTAPRNTAAAFSGPLNAPPPQPLQPLQDHILATLGLAAGAQLRRQDLVAYLATGPVLDLMLRYSPAAEQFLSTRLGPLGSSPREIVRTILINGAAFAPRAGGGADPRASLAAIASGMSRGMMDQAASLLDRLLDQNQITEPGLRMAVEEILLPSMRLAFGTALPMAMDWPAHANRAEQLQEALSAVLMKLVGRSLVLTADIVLVATQTQIGEALENLARTVEGPRGIVSVLSKAANLPIPASEIGEVTADALRIGAEVLGPLTSAQRTRIRALLYEAIDGLPAGTSGAALLNDLADPMFIPNGAAINHLARELAGIGGERFLHFVERLITLIASKALEDLLEAIEAQKRQIAGWLTEAQRSAEALGRLAEQLARAAAAAADRAAECIRQAANALLDAFAPLATRAGRTALRAALADSFINETLEKLERNDIYRTLAPPPVKTAMRGMARQALEHAFDNGLVDTLLTALGRFSADLSGLLDDAQRLDHDRDLIPQLRTLLRARLNAGMTSLLGHDQQIAVGFRIEIAGQRMEVNLGRIALPTGRIATAITTAVELLPAFEIAIRGAALALAAAHREEQRARDKRRASREGTERSEKLRRQRAGILDAAPGLRVHSPAAAKVAGPSLLIDFEISGVERAHLTGDGLSPPLMQVYLNGAPLPLGDFSFETIAGRAPPPGPRDRSSTGTTGRPLPSTVGLGERIARTTPIGVASRLIGTTAPQPAGNIAGSRPGIRFSRRVMLDELEEGLNTLVISVHAGDGERHDTSVAFFAPAQGAPPSRAAVRIGGRAAPVSTGLPRIVAGKYLLASKMSRVATAKSARDLVETEGRRLTDSVKAMRQIGEG